MMSGFTTIKIKALFLLTVFTANFYAVCHCHHNASRLAMAAHVSGIQAAAMSSQMAASVELSSHTQSSPAAQCSHCHKPDASTRSRGAQKDGCCGGHALQFGLLDKQTAERIGITASPGFILTNPFTLSAIRPADPLRAIAIPKDEWSYKKAPPDLLSLYQTFLI